MEKWLEKEDMEEIIKLAWNEWAPGQLITIYKDTKNIVELSEDEYNEYDDIEKDIIFKQGEKKCFTKYFTTYTLGNVDYSQVEGEEIYVLQPNFIANGCFEDGAFLDEWETEDVTKWCEENNVIFAPENRWFWEKEAIEILEKLGIEEEYDERMINYLIWCEGV